MTPYTVTLCNTTPQAAVAALASMVANNAAAKRYLDDVNDSDPGVSRDYLIGLVSEAYALTDAEAQAIYREWVKGVE